MTELLNNSDPLVEISVQDPIWETLGDIEGTVREAALLSLTFAMTPKVITDVGLEVSLVLANDELVQVLNREYRNKDKPTNVLTFASMDCEEFELENAETLKSGVGMVNLGDVILSYQTITRECQEQGKFVLDHIKHLTVHGVLHLLGYDHQDDNEATDMETLEIRILEQLDVQNPYTFDDTIETIDT